LVILAGSRAGVEADLANVSTESMQSLIVVDAITPTQKDSDRPSAEVESVWIATMLPEARIVRAFASVPAQAFTDLVEATTPDTDKTLAVPLAGDDPEAKALVETFMRDIGVEPFDLGALSNAEVLEPGGQLWGRALSQLEMIEAVGELSGDG
jgi:hypothetical protein